MLRRLSDATFGSIEKILNITGSNEKEKKRKLVGESARDSKNTADKENKVMKLI